MNKYIRTFGILAILCFSFYCAEQTALLMQKKDPLYETILAVKEDYTVDSIDAKISNEYIIPGMVGAKINIKESFKNMKSLGAFQESQLVFDEIKPSISLEENKNKIVKQGNLLKKGVSFIVSDEELILFLEEMCVPYAVLTTKENIEKNRAYGIKINNDFNSYNEVEKVLMKKNESNNFCFIGDSNIDTCEAKKKITIDSNKKINKANFAKSLSQITSGDIIYLQSNLGFSNLKLLLEQIYFKGLTVLTLNELISETR